VLLLALWRCGIFFLDFEDKMIKGVNSLVVAVVRPRHKSVGVTTVRALSSSSSGATPTTFSHEQMQKDPRYAPANPVPESVLESMRQSDRVVYSPGFSIKGEALSGRPAYLDFQATTPLDPRVLDAMLPFLTERYGNPHSKTHSYGWETEKAIEDARENIAKLIGASSKEIIFTSGATESNNMAIKGVAHFYREHKKHVITTQTEHKCVLDSCRALENEGFEITYLPVKSNGLIDIEQLKAAIRPDTVLVSVMGVNNEIGVVQPLKEIGQICRSKKVFFHTDIAQMAGKMPINVDEMNIDLASISSHKVRQIIVSLRLNVF
jgi:cysteine desulfurase